jgi:hypothetical protein
MIRLLLTWLPATTVCLCIGSENSEAAPVPDTGKIFENLAPAIVSVTAGRAPHQTVQRGSGILIKADSPPVVATALHVLEGMTHASFQLASGRALAVAGVVLDPKRDLAFLVGPAKSSVSSAVAWKRPSTQASQSLALAGYRLGELTVRPCTLASLPVQMSKLLARGARTTNTDFQTFSLGSGEIFPGDSGGPLLDGDEQLVGLVLGTIQLKREQGGPVHFGVPVDAAVPAITAFVPLTSVKWSLNRNPYGSLADVNPATAVVLRAMAISRAPRPPVHASPETRCAPILRSVADGLAVSAETAGADGCRSVVATMQALFEAKLKAWRTLRGILDLENRTLAVEAAGRAHMQARLVETSEHYARVSQRVVALSDLCRQLGGGIARNPGECLQAGLRAKVGIDDLSTLVPRASAAPVGSRSRSSLQLLLTQTDAFGESTLAESLAMEGVAQTAASAPGIKDLDSARCDNCGAEWARLHQKVAKDLEHGKRLTRAALERRSSPGSPVLDDKARRAEDVMVTQAVLEGAMDLDPASTQLSTAAEIYSQTVDDLGALQNICFQQATLDKP